MATIATEHRLLQVKLGPSDFANKKLLLIIVEAAPTYLAKAIIHYCNRVCHSLA